jgi:hypothetical protein
MREGHSAATEHTMLHHQHDARSDDPERVRNRIGNAWCIAGHHHDLDAALKRATSFSCAAIRAMCRGS